MNNGESIRATVCFDNNAKDVPSRSIIITSSASADFTHGVSSTRQLTMGRERWELDQGDSQSKPTFPSVHKRSLGTCEMTLCASNDS